MEPVECPVNNDNKAQAGTPFGNGNYGHWVNDAQGQPAYAYAPESGPSAGHWHLVGNDRIIATAHGLGFVQIYDWTRGGKRFNRWDPARNAYSGGFKFVRLGETSFCTLADHIPTDATQTMIFGMGYSEKCTEYRQLRITERIEAPIGDDVALLSTTTVENRGAEVQTMEITEFWAVNPHQIFPTPFITHGLNRPSDWLREQLNRLYEIDSFWDRYHRTLGISFAYRFHKPAPDKPTLIDYYPETVFLTALDELPPDYNGFITDGRPFFGDAGLDHAPGLSGAADGKLLTRRSAYRGHGVLAMRRPITLAPGEQVTLRYLYGYAAKADIGALTEKYQSPLPGQMVPQMEFTAPEAPWLSRELAWHSYYLQAGSIYQDVFKAHVVDQGSAYMMEHGVGGVARDYSMYIIPLIYLRPDLAKEALRFIIRMQDAKTGVLPYSFICNGKMTGAGVHANNSDLDLFLSWAMGEYLGVTRDLDFLQELNPYYPPSAGRYGTVLEHLHVAFAHLTDYVGLGAHGVIHCGSGDWNDVLLGFSNRRGRTAKYGESSLNAGMAATVLPMLADAIQEVAPDFAKNLREYGAAQAAALRQFWNGQWAARGYLGHKDEKLGDDRIFLDTQPWGVLGNVWSPKEQKILFDQIRSKCVEPQRMSARCLWPPVKGLLLDPGSDTHGGTWAAIDSWLAWAWSKFDPQAGWDYFLRTTMAAHAEAYPHIWYGIWSGPDSYNADYHARPGETFNVNATNMTLFPVMNMNRHFSPLFIAIKLAGIEALGGRIIVDPKLPFDRFSLRLPLISVVAEAGSFSGEYHPIVTDTFEFAIRPPKGVTDIHLLVNDQAAAFTVDDRGLVCFSAAGSPGQPIRWVVR